MSDKVFAEWIIFKAPREWAPEFVKWAISIKTEEFVNFLWDQNKEWVNLDVKESKNGKLYVELNTYQPKEELNF